VFVLVLAPEVELEVPEETVFQRLGEPLVNSCLCSLIESPMHRDQGRMPRCHLHCEQGRLSSQASLLHGPLDTAWKAYDSSLHMS